MLDTVFLGELLREMRLPGSRINKINQPERDEIFFTLYGPTGSHRLLLSANASAPRLQYTDAPRENPQQAPMFCMFLRKYLTGALITEVRQPGGDRIAELHLDCTDEFGYPSHRRLIAELMGRYSNIILVDDEGRIMECLKRVDASMSPSRQVMPGLFYRYPTLQGKLSLDESSDEVIFDRIREAPEDAVIEKYLLDHFAWLSPITCREAAHLACGDSGARIRELPEREALSRVIAEMAERIRRGDTAPYLLYETRVDTEGRHIRKPADFSYLPIAQYGSLRELVPAESYCALLDEFYSVREAIGHMQQRTAAVRKSVKGARSRLVQKLEAQRRELSQSQGREEFRRAGDLITSSLYLLERGMSKAALPDYEAMPDENGQYPMVEVKLDPQLSPQDNAQRYYKQYRRAKNAEAMLHELIARGERELIYLDSVADELTRAVSERELTEIKAELSENGYASQRWGQPKGKGGKRQKLPTLKPMEFVSSSGYPILAGRNNRQNEQISLKIAGKSDIWLHAQKVPGSHVLIQCGNAVPDDRTLEEAAIIAAYHSAARDNGTVVVDYTKARHVRRQPEGKTGMVFYQEYQTLIVQPDQALVERLTKK
ncbi:MAG: fibronectin/fibrinogen-binding protein [Ruminococcaceae bacterium]|nr:fibronectin/fibrinogen-binding protein [Oscillospiraceae bacterium]